MKLGFYFLPVILFISNPTLAKGETDSDTFAEYTVPTSADLIDFSRFHVKINQPYIGDASNTLSYTFPEELTGNPPLTVNLKRIPGTKNSWESPELTAHCTTVDDWFSCNIYLNKSVPKANKSMSLVDLFNGAAITKTPLASSTPFINKQKVIDFLTQNAVSAQSLQQQIDVLDQFLSSEPAGILSYEF